MKREDIDNKTFQDIYVLGDTHGNMSKLGQYLQLIENSLIIQVGDFGLGFRSETSEHNILNELNAKMKDSNTTLIVIRGNHCDPDRYGSGSPHEFDRIYFPDDYSDLTVNNKKIIFVGGAISIDRVDRVEGLGYWSGEPLQPIRDGLKNCDILVSHTCPSYHNNPAESGADKMLDFYLNRDSTLLNDLKNERSIMDEIVETTKPQLNIHGHFHNKDNQTIKFEWGECYFDTVDIDECRPITKWFK